MTKQLRLALSSEVLDWRYHYKAGILGAVVTGTEVTEIWQVSRATLDRAWIAGELEARKSVTGGTILFTVRSIVGKFGEPKIDAVQALRDEPHQLSLFDLDKLSEMKGT